MALSTLIHEQNREQLFKKKVHQETCCEQRIRGQRTITLSFGERLFIAKKNSETTNDWKKSGMIN